MVIVEGVLLSGASSATSGEEPSSKCKEHRQVGKWHDWQLVCNRIHH
jgi:hypothetical protein